MHKIGLRNKTVHKFIVAYTCNFVWTKLCSSGSLCCNTL